MRHRSIRFLKDLTTLSLIGAATFFLAKTKQPIARIPFTAIVELSIRTVVPEQRNLKDANGTAVRIEWQGPSLLEGFGIGMDSTVNRHCSNSWAGHSKARDFGGC